MSSQILYERTTRTSPRGPAPAAPSPPPPTSMLADERRCFTYLDENTPKWTADLSSLERYMEEQSGGQSREPTDAPAPVRRTASALSVREEITHDSTYASKSSTPKDSAHQSAIRRSNLLTTRRKSVGSTASTLVSGPTIYRADAMVVVHYDGEIQQRLERLVRDIGVGRQIIKKCRYDASTEAVAREMYGSGTPGLAAAAAADEDLPPSLRLPAFRRGAGQRSPSGRSRESVATGPPSAFDRVLIALERAQSFCERGAHQHLRSGTCRTEIRGARRACEAVVSISKDELRRSDLHAAKMVEETATTPVTLQLSESSQALAEPSGSPDIIEAVDGEEEQTQVSLPMLRVTSTGHVQQPQGPLRTTTSLHTDDPPRLPEND